MLKGGSKQAKVCPKEAFCHLVHLQTCPSHGDMPSGAAKKMSKVCPKEAFCHLVHLQACPSHGGEPSAEVLKPLSGGQNEGRRHLWQAMSHFRQRDWQSFCS
jgi:hypothetical protein